jgi:hypothetical protein
MSGGWGEGGSPQRDGTFPSQIALGNGNKMTINAEAFKALLQHPRVVEATAARARAIADTANSLAITEGAEYEVIQHSDGSASVGDGGEDPYKARIDDAYHATLLKAMGSGA